MYGTNITPKYGNDYDPQHFLDIWEEMGEEMDRFASDPRIEMLYDASIDVAKPPAQLLARPLRKTPLGQRLLANPRARQGFGHFTRHVMRKRGYTLDREEVRIPNPTVFSFGARYRADGEEASQDGTEADAAAPDTSSSGVGDSGAE